MLFCHGNRQTKLHVLHSRHHRHNRAEAPLAPKSFHNTVRCAGQSIKSILSVLPFEVKNDLPKSNTATTRTPPLRLNWTPGAYHILPPAANCFAAASILLLPKQHSTDHSKTPTGQAHVSQMAKGAGTGQHSNWHTASTTTEQAAGSDVQPWLRSLVTEPAFLGAHAHIWCVVQGDLSIPHISQSLACMDRRRATHTPDQHTAPTTPALALSAP
jgi:hypothetical protein